MEYDLKKIASKFLIYGNYLAGDPYGNGHINHTYKLTYNQAGLITSYILQKINTDIFKESHKMMENIVRITEHQKQFYSNFDDSSRHHLTLIKTIDGSYLHEEADGTLWRVYLFIDHSVTYEVMENEEYAYKTAKSFGEFQKSIVDLKGGRLHEVIPDFHNTPKRFEALDRAIVADVGNRAASVKKEIELAMSMRDKSSILFDLHKKGLIPERVVHNDTKLNNLMIDIDTGEPVCVIDLDIVMPGFSIFDFGELTRTSVSPTQEDERDLSKIHVRLNVYEALFKGFMEAVSDFINEEEKKHLPWGGYLMALENGVRFLTDHLNMDKYFRIHRANHNLDRCRSQFALVKSIENSWDDLCKLIEKY